MKLCNLLSGLDMERCEPLLLLMVLRDGGAMRLVDIPHRMSFKDLSTDRPLPRDAPRRYDHGMWTLGDDGEEYHWRSFARSTVNEHARILVIEGLANKLTIKGYKTITLTEEGYRVARWLNIMVRSCSDYIGEDDED